jgi:tetratricopeptide (TPR) repeat protein
MSTAKIPMTFKKLLMGLAVTGIFFVVLELIFALFGVGGAHVVEDPYVGFAKHSPLFVEASGGQGSSIMQTAPNKLQWFNPQSFPKQKAPNSYRIFCVGGSTTYGRPFEDATSFAGWLREYLKAARPSTKWEVINAGGISYASYRVSALMEELADYQPDLFIVYSGHNEFLEHRTYATLVNTPKALLAGASLLARTRTYAAMQAAIRRPQRPVSASGTEPSGTELSGEVSAVLDESVGPQSYVRDDTQREQIIRHYELNLHRMVKIAQSSHAEILFVMPASNIRDMSPFKSQDSPGLTASGLQAWQEAYRSAVERLRRQDASRARIDLERAIALNPRHAQTHYVIGQCQLQLGRHANARDAFVRALEEDVCPLRILPAMQDALRRVCAHHEIALLDFDGFLADACQETFGYAIPGKELFFDHVHPRPHVHRMLALALFDHLASVGAVGVSASALRDDVKQAVIERVEGGLDPQARGRALRNLAKVMSWAGKVDEAETAATQALALLGEDSEVLHILGVTSMAKQKNDVAENYCWRAIAADKRNVDAHNNLGTLLLLREDLSGAVIQFQEAIRLSPNTMKAHYNLGNAHLRQSNFAAAQSAYEEALKKSPDNPAILNNLAYVLIKQGLHDEAIQNYRHMLALDPNDAGAAHNLETALRMADRASKP